MFITCATVYNMSKMIQIRNVPDDLHRKLKAQAAELGMTLSDYLLSEVRQLAERPTLQEVLAQLDREVPLTVEESSAEIIRELRGA